MLSLDLYSFFILLSVVNCLLLSVLLLVSSHKRGQGNGLLAATIIFYTLPVLRIITNVTGFFRAFAGLSFLFVELLFGLGPSLYLYARSVTDPHYKLTLRAWLHYLPVLTELVYYMTHSYASVGRYTLHLPSDVHHA